MPKGITPKSLNRQDDTPPTVQTPPISPTGSKVAQGFAISCSVSSLCSFPKTFSRGAGKTDVL